MESSIDKIIALYQHDIDVTLIRENLKLTPTQRLEKLEDFMNFMEECREAGMRAQEQRIAELKAIRSMNRDKDIGSP